MTDTDKLALLLLNVVHSLTSSPHAERDERWAEAGYLLRDLGWPGIIQDIRDGGYEMSESLDKRGFDRV